MRLIASLTCLAGTCVSLKSGVVSGVVLERQSGIPLARAKVRLDRVDLSGRVQSDSLIAGRAGQFTSTTCPTGFMYSRPCRMVTRPLPLDNAGRKERGQPSR